MKTTWKQEKAFLEGGGLADDERSGIEASNADILRKYPSKVMMASIRARAARSKKLPAWLLYTATAAAALLLVPFFMLPDDDGLRTKGGDALLLYREASDGPELLTDGSLAAEGDVIQAAWRSEDGRFGVIVSLDGRGVWTRHTEQAMAWSRPEDGGARPLDFSVRLDDAPDFETFYLVTAPSRFLASEAIERIQSQETPADWRIVSVQLLKRALP